MSDEGSQRTDDETNEDGAAATELPAPQLAGSPTATPVATARDDAEWSFTFGVGVMQLAGLASIGAGIIHAGAIGIHAEHVTLARLFVACAAAQLAVGLLALIRGGRLAAALTVTVNAIAVGGWLTTRMFGISWIDGLEQSEKPQFTDTVCAALGAIAVAAALGALIWRRTEVRSVRLGLPAWAIGSFVVVATLLGTTHVHSHGAEAAAGHTHDDAAALTTDDTTATTVHDHTTADTTATADPAGVASGLNWPRPYDPAQPIDVAGVPGVTRAQELRAAALIRRTQDDLPRFADVNAVGALGYQSIGDASTGFEHYINYSYIGDDKFLDPTAPESLVYQVNGDQRTLVSAMFIANGIAIDDPDLVNYGGPLMQWHVHQNLCWTGGENGPRVVGVVDANGNCPPGSVNAGGGNPMVHVWIAPHPCGPFAALEGHGAGQTTDDATRTDQCAAGHDHHSTTDAAASGTATPAAAADGQDHSAAAAATPVPYDPTLPIDLSGTPGVTPQQQAFAENLVATTLVKLPQWSDPAVAEAAGFRSIGDGATGHEHFVQWDWINDDVYLDPDHPESLVYEPQPDGSRRLVSAMYMLPQTYTLDSVPDWGGALMQWHIHDNLCFTPDPDAPRVGGLTNADGSCTAPLVKFGEVPMIHVWITTNPCGPFAALEGIGAGQIAEGETRLCDTAHGSH